MQAESRGRTPLRSVAALVLAMVALSALAITPAVAAKFLTKKKADKRYLGNTAVATVTTTVPDGTGATITVPCPPGLQATGGGASSPAFITSNTAGEGMLMLERKPQVSGWRSVGWITEVINATSGPLAITGHAVCAP